MAAVSRPRTIAALAVVVALLGAASAASAGRPVAGSLTFEGVERHYLVYAGAPSSARGLVLLLHGHAGSAEQLLGMTAGRAPYRVWMRIADREGLVLVVPDGLRGGDGRRGWNDCRGASTSPSSDDVGFLETLVRRVATRTGVDPGRFFVAGTSNGGVMALRLAVERPKLFRAFAAIVAAMPAASRCPAPTVPVPILLMNGTADPLMPWAGGNVGGGSGARGAVLSADRTVALWTAVDKAVGEPRVEKLPDLDQTDGSRVTRLSWEPGQAGAPVVLYRVDGGGHVEPSRAERYRRVVTAILGPQNGDIEMADEIWSFFKRQQR